MGELDNLPDEEIPTGLTNLDSRATNRQLIKEIIRHKMLSRSRRCVTGKARKWLRAYLDQDNPATFLKPTPSAIEAGYKSSNARAYSALGKHLKSLFDEEINNFLDREGLSETAIKGKLANLLDAKETKFWADKGIVTDQRDVEALGIQIKAVELGMKLRKMLTEKVEHSGNVAMTASLTDEDRALLQESVEARKRSILEAHRSKIEQE